MTSDSPSSTAVTLGDPVPGFTARTITGASFDLSVAAGRWIVLCFLGTPADPRASRELAQLLEDAQLFDEDRLCVYGIFTAPPADPSLFVALGSRALAFFADYDGAISQLYGALGSPRTVVIDPMLRAVANIPWDYPQGHAQSLRALLKSLPSVDDQAGVAMSAPVLIVPRVFDFALCDFMIDLFENVGGEELRLHA